MLAARTLSHVPAATDSRYQVCAACLSKFKHTCLWLCDACVPCENRGTPVLQHTACQGRSRATPHGLRMMLYPRSHSHEHKDQRLSMLASRTLSRCPAAAGSRRLVRAACLSTLSHLCSCLCDSCASVSLCAHPVGRDTRQRFNA